MYKDFDKWNEKKKILNAKNLNKILFFSTGEVWWISLGLNLGFEMNGKGEDFMRPAIILKKYNHYSFLALPLSTSKKSNRYCIPIGIIDGKEAIANLSQIRNIDSKRLVNKIGYIENELFRIIKEKTRRVNLD
jgi:mRNA interferase MazF